MKRLRSILMGSAATLFAAALVLAEPALSGRTATADQWQERWGTEGITCEGCCGSSPNTFCCTINALCKHVKN